jgi:hypothetical protein
MYGTLAPLAELEWQVQSSSSHTVAIANTPDQEAVGTATWCLTFWAEERGLAGLYEIQIAESYQGLFVLLLPERRFAPYNAWMECVNLPTEPQKVLDRIASIETLKNRHLFCVVRRKRSVDMIGAWQIYAQRLYWKEGRYEGWPYPRFADAVRAMGRAHPEWIMIPQFVENFSLWPYSGYVEVHFDVRGRSVDMLGELLPADARWVGSYDGIVQIRFTAVDPTVLNAVLPQIREHWGADKLWIPE